jgi:hypothetical protein
MASQAPSCAGVGLANDASNHARVGALKRSRAVMPCSLSLGTDTDPAPKAVPLPRTRPGPPHHPISGIFAAGGRRRRRFAATVGG